MYSNLIDQETFAAVVAAAPRVTEYKLDLAREIVQVLWKGARSSRVHLEDLHRNLTVSELAEGEQRHDSARGGQDPARAGADHHAQARRLPCVLEP